MIDDSIRYDRNIRLFGADGQNRIKAARVGVAGLGGLGCRLVQHLAYLGVTRYVLVDADRTGSHSLNRLVTAHPDDVGQYKTDLAERLIRSINPQAEVINIRHHVPHPDAVDALAELALILGGLDMPLIVHWGMNHFMVVERIRESGVDIRGPECRPAADHARRVRRGVHGNRVGVDTDRSPEKRSKGLGFWKFVWPFLPRSPKVVSSAPATSTSRAPVFRGGSHLIPG